MKQGARTLTHESLTDLRRRGVASVQDGHTPDEVAETLGVSRAAVFSWLAMYRGGGWDGLRARKRGGRPRKLTAKHVKWIYKTVVGKRGRAREGPLQRPRH